MSPLSQSKSKDKIANMESQKALESSGSGNAGIVAAASAYNPLLGTFHNLETSSVPSASGRQTNGRFHNIDVPDEHPGGSQLSGAEYDSVSNNGSWSGESEDHKEKILYVPTRSEAAPGSDSDKRDKVRQKNERKHQRQKERRAQELHERCTGYLMSRKLEALAQQIVQMGFPHECATMSLILNEGRVAEAVVWLLEGGEDGENYKDKNIGGGNLKIDISREFAQIADMEMRYHCSRQEVERVVVACEGDLEKAAVSLREMKHDSPKAEESSDPPIISNGKLSVCSQTSSPELEVILSPNQPKMDEKDFTKGAVVLASSMESKVEQSTKRMQSQMECPKPQQAAFQAENKWTDTGANHFSSCTPLQVSTTPKKTESGCAAPIGDYNGSFREPTIMMQLPQSVNAKQIPSPASAASRYLVNGIDAMKPNVFLPSISSLRNLGAGYLSSNQLYQRHQYQTQQQFGPGTSSGDPKVSSRGYSLRGRTGTAPTIYAAASLGLFSGLGSTGRSGASCTVDWNTASAWFLLELDYTNIDWSLDRNLNMPLPRSNGLWLEHSPFTETTAHIYDSKSDGSVRPSMRSGLFQDGVSTGETSASNAWDSSSPFEEDDLFNLHRQFVSSPSL